MTYRYSSAFSHLILGATGFCCYMKYHRGPFKMVLGEMPSAAYGIIITNSALGVWRFGNPKHGKQVEKPYKFTAFLQALLALPLIVTEVLLRYGMQKEFAYLHVLACVLPFTLYLAHRSKGDLVDLIIGINCVSLGMLSYVYENYFGVAAAVSYLFNHFWLKEGHWCFEDTPVLDLCNYGLCFFCYFALRALGGHI